MKEEDFTRKPAFAEREKLQKAAFALPKFPTTTIGSFPQTADVKANRKAFKAGNITKEEYDAFNREKIRACVKLQEELDLDVLVHGEYERNDMVEYFGEQLNGYLFTEKVLWYEMCKAAHRLGRHFPRKTDDCGVVGIREELHEPPHEGHAHRPGNYPELVLPA